MGFFSPGCRDQFGRAVSQLEQTGESLTGRCRAMRHFTNFSSADRVVACISRYIFPLFLGLLDGWAIIPECPSLERGELCRGYETIRGSPRLLTGEPNAGGTVQHDCNPYRDIRCSYGRVLFAFWVAMGIWTLNDIRSRTRDWLAIALASLLVLIFPLVGLVLYMMIRPRETLADVFDRALEEESLLRELEATLSCHRCGVPVQDNWNFCSNCHCQLRFACSSCGKGDAPGMEHLRKLRRRPA